MRNANGKSSVKALDPQPIRQIDKLQQRQQSIATLIQQDLIVELQPVFTSSGRYAGADFSLLRCVQRVRAI